MTVTEHNVTVAKQSMTVTEHNMTVIEHNVTVTETKSTNMAATKCDRYRTQVDNKGDNFAVPEHYMTVTEQI